MKAIKYLVFSLLIFSLFPSCSKKQDKVEPVFNLETSDNIDDNEYQIYSLILKEYFTTSNTLIVTQKTSNDVSASIGNTYCQILKAENPNLDTTIFTDIVDKNVSTYNLANNFSNSTKTISMISNYEVQYFFGSQDIIRGWNAFYEKYPNSNGMIDFTRVGFNSDKSQAIVEIGHYYESLGGNGSLIYLVKDNHGWSIVKTIDTWVS